VLAWEGLIRAVPDKRGVAPTVKEAGQRRRRIEPARGSPIEYLLR
jgi:hypothetical protein